MKLSTFGVKYPVTTSMIFIAFVVLGAFSWTRVGIDLMPDFEIPALTIITAYKGAGPKEVETRITKPIEDAVSTVQNVSEVNSISFEGVSMVVVKFNWGTNMAEVTNDIRDKLDLATRNLPDEADKPIIFKFNNSNIPVLVMGVYANESWEKLDRIVDNRIIDQIKRIPGVATALRRGGDIRAIKVKLNREKLKAIGITGNQIVNILRAQNINIPGGTLKSETIEYLVRTPEEFQDVNQIGNVVIARSPGVVRLKDVAEIEDGFLEKKGDFLLNGHRAYGILVQKQSGANTVEVAKRVREAIPSILEKLPSDVKIDLVFDTSEFIINTINNLKNSVITGGIAVLLVLLYFLKDIRASIIVGLTIPTSLIITFLLMYVAEYTINQISLSSLAIAIGMVVDNAIVIVDNIKRYLERGISAVESAIWGSSEMTSAVVASTLTTVVIFLPIIFTKGLTKIIFGQLAVIVILALMSSLFTALLLTPMLASKMLKPINIDKNDNEISSNLNFISKLEIYYEKLLVYVLDNKIKVFAVLLLATFGSLSTIKIIGTEFIPEQDQGRLVINYELPVGTRYEITTKVGIEIASKAISLIPEIEAITVRSGKSADAVYAALSGSKESSHTGRVEMRLVKKSRRKRNVKQIIEDIRPEIAKIPGIIVRYDASDPLANNIGLGGAPFTLNLYGYDLEAGYEAAKKLVNLLESKVKGLKDLEINQEVAQPEIQIIVDREKASAFGLNVSDIGKAIELYIAGNTTVKYREAGEEYDIEVRFREEDRTHLEDIGQIPISTPYGQTIRLENIAQIKFALGPTRITRNEQERFIQITGQVYGRGSADVAKDAAKVISAFPLPPGFSWKFAGNEEERQKSFKLMLQVMILGMILVYMVMASQFESLLAPFIIFFSVPFGFVGAVLFLALGGFRISIISLLGFIILIGIVVNNGIVLISYINILIQRKIPIKEAIIRAGKHRLRPVLATTFTTIIGMIPMTFSKGEGSEVWVPLSLSLIGGLSISTLMTLLLMPMLYHLMCKRFC